MIHGLDIISFQDNKLVLQVDCGKGTYIRSLAHDLGIALHSGAHLSGLRRTKIGTYTAEGAKNPMEWADYFGKILKS